MPDRSRRQAGRQQFEDADLARRDAREPRRLSWIDGASHVDLYDKEQYVGPAVTELAGFFRENLAPSAREGKTS